MFGMKTKIVRTIWTTTHLFHSPARLSTICCVYCWGEARAAEEISVVDPPTSTEGCGGNISRAAVHLVRGLISGECHHAGEQGVLLPTIASLQSIP